MRYLGSMKIIITLLLAVSVKMGFSQTNNFAPVGATWWYDALNDCGGPGTECGYFTLESIGDTIISAKICRILKEEHFEIGMTYPIQHHYLYEDSGRVFIFKEGNFYRMLDFTAQPLDTIMVINNEFSGFTPFADYTYNSFKYFVDSISNIHIGGTELKFQYVNAFPDGDGWGFGQAQIIEMIGSTWLPFGQPNGTAIEFGSFLRCYEDAELSYHNPLYYQNCDFVSGIADQPAAKILVFPNPVKQKVQIDLSAYKLNDPCILLLYDLTGKLVYTSNLISGEINEVNMSALSDGIYFLSIYSDAVQIVSDKLVKQ